MSAATGYATESLAADALDTILRASNLFRIYHEVPGTLVQPRPGQDTKGMRIDRLLTPLPRLLAKEWNNGVIGIEIKKDATDKTLGPAISQAIDYTRSVFELPNGIKVIPTFVFLFPFHAQAGSVSSVMTQNNVGTAHTSTWSLLKLQIAATNVLNVHPDGDFTVQNPTSGRKAGSR